MGSLVGHVAPGLGFLVIGLWHLYNHAKLHSLRLSSAHTLPLWFPFSLSLRYLEPFLIAVGAATSIAMELFIGPRRRQPLDDDWTIPSYHLHNFEHSSISLSILIYAVFTIVLDRVRHTHHRPTLHALLQAVGAAAFFQEFLLFHLHSTDHAGVEGQYHWLLQLVIAASLVAMLVGMWKPRSFLVSYMRSATVAFQGVWFIFLGYFLYIPGLIPKGCYLDVDDGRLVEKCRDEASLQRAKALANLEFSWCLSAMVVFCVVFYLAVSSWFQEHKEKYVALGNFEEEEEDEDVEAQKRKLGGEEFGSLVKA